MVKVNVNVPSVGVDVRVQPVSARHEVIIVEPRERPRHMKHKKFKDRD